MHHVAVTSERDTVERVRQARLPGRQQRADDIVETRLAFARHEGVDLGEARAQVRELVRIGIHRGAAPDNRNAVAKFGAKVPGDQMIERRVPIVERQAHKIGLPPPRVVEQMARILEQPDIDCLAKLSFRVRRKEADIQRYIKAEFCVFIEVAEVAERDSQ